MATSPASASRPAILAAMALASAAILVSCAHEQASHDPKTGVQAVVDPLAELRRDALSLAPLVKTTWVRRFLDASAALPSIPPRTLYHDAAKTRYYREDERAALAPSDREGLASRVLDGDFYYNTRYGTPLAYARPFDLLSEDGFAPDGSRVLDFGFGGIGQLRLLASLGANVTGVEVDPLTRALYSFPGDQGTIPRFERGRPDPSSRSGGPSGAASSGGSVRLIYGRFPVDDTVRSAVAGGYDLFISKNTLKRGYVHPEKPVPERQRIDLGLSDEGFVRALYDMLAPGGHVMIYNICPAPAPPDKPYIPWADGRSPFDESLWQATGFRVIAFDRDDSAAARAMGHALGWDALVDGPDGKVPGMDLEHDLFALYTLVAKPL